MWKCLFTHFNVTHPHHQKKLKACSMQQLKHKRSTGCELTILTLLSDETKRFTVFLDEAGLPNEKMESLKALHYPLDNPVVAFIAISNNHLDSAKENRMACLQRDKPTIDDLETLAQGKANLKLYSLFQVY